MTKSMTAWVLAAVLAAGCTARSTSPEQTLPDLEVPYEKHVLPNGLRVIIHEDHKAPLVTVAVWYHVGSKDERPGRTGFAHLFEHLMFNGSENHNDEYFRPLQAVGATGLNGTTWLDRTNYYQTVPKNALDLTLWLESDRMGHLLGAIDQAKLDEQRGVVQNEKRQRENQPYGKVNEVIAANTYPAGHPYSWPTIGSMEDLNAATLEDVHEWFRTYYGAANALVVISGDVDAEEVKRKVEHYFGDIPAGPPVRRHQAWIAKMTGKKRMALQERVPQARIYKVWNVPGRTEREHALLGLAAQVLAGSKSSRLYKRLVHGEQLATTVSAGAGPFEIGSQFQMIATVKPEGDPATVEAIMDEELQRFLREGPTAEELERAKTAIYAQIVRGLESNGGKAWFLAEGELYSGQPDFHNRYIAWMREATPASVRETARAWLSDGEFVLTVHPRPDYVTATEGADRSRLPDVGPPPDLVLPALQRTRLANGLEVVLAEQHSVPIVQMTLILDIGTAADSLATPGTANMTFAMVDEGTRTRDAFQIAEEAERLGAFLSSGSSLDTSYFGLNAIKSELEGSLELFADVLLNPTFPEKELERLKGQTLAALKQERVQPSGMAGRVLPRLVFGEGHAYANPFSGMGTEESVQALTREDLVAFYSRWVRPDNARLLVVGDVTLAELEPLLERHLGKWTAPDEPLPAKNIAAVRRERGPRLYLMDRPGSEQSLILAAHAAPSRSAEQFLAMQAVNVILGGSFTSRLNMNLREQKGWAYGARSSLSSAKGPGLFSMSTSVQTDKTAEAIREALKEARDLLKTRPPSAAEIKMAIDTLVLTLPGQNETIGGIANSIAEILTFGLKDDYWNDYVSEVRALDAQTLQAAARRLLDPDALTWIVVGDLSKIEAEVRQLGFADVKVIDPDGRIIS